VVFSSNIFLYVFLPIFTLAYMLVPKKNMVLLLASLVFYAWGEPHLILLMVGVSGMNYLFSQWVSGATRYRKWYLTVAVSLNVLILVVFKYLDFIVGNINIILAKVGISPLPLPGLPLPMGISFFIFQALTYVVDVYRRHASASQKFGDVLLYISLFPQLVAGPIVRYEEIADQIKSRISNWQRVISGVERFVIGLAKKVIIADSLSVPVDAIFKLGATELSFGVAWLGIVAFALQIFFDFSGYSDMAIGIGRALGFDFPENFNQPYRSRSIQEFWRRWHMTLSRWFRDYVYIPLGGNRMGIGRTYLNLLIVFVLTGFWHGASWNFLIWGLIHGLFLVLERLGLEKLLLRVGAPISNAYVTGVVLLGWVFFRAEDFPGAYQFLRALADIDKVPAFLKINEIFDPYLFAVMLAGLIIAILPEKMPRWEMPKSLGVQIMKYSFLFVLFFFSLALVASYSQKAFIYFRF
jgi:alginate O-acetyltransferase complex protein AlgI